LTTYLEITNERNQNDLCANSGNAAYISGASQVEEMRGSHRLESFKEIFEVIPNLQDQAGLRFVTVIARSKPKRVI
jgi:hypothetical protein